MTLETFNVDPDDIAPEWDREEMAQRIFANCAALAAPDVTKLDKGKGIAYLSAFASYARLAAAVYFEAGDDETET